MFLITMNKRQVLFSQFTAQRKMWNLMKVEHQNIVNVWFCIIMEERQTFFLTVHCTKKDVELNERGTSCVKCGTS